MWQLVRNGIRRLWWLYLLAATASVIAFPNSPEEFIHYSAVIIFFTGILVFTFETGGFGKFRVHTMLPVTAAQRGRAYSILFVAITPAINILIYIMGAIPHFLMPKIVPEPAPFFWYIAVVFFVTGFLCLFLQIVQFGIRFPYGWKKAVWELSSVAFLLIMLVMAIYFIYRLGMIEYDYFVRNLSISNGPNGPFSYFINNLTIMLAPEPNQPNLYDASALGVATLCIFLTFYKADSLGRYITCLALQQEQSHDDTILPVNNRAYGFFEPWIREMQNGVRVLVILIFSSFCALFLVWLLIPVPLPRLLIGFLTAVPWPFILIVITGLLSIPPIIPWFVSIRSLRMLPFSRKSLMFYLASIPLLVFTVYSIVLLIACLYFKDWNYALNLEWCLIVVFGFSMIANSLVLLSRHTLLTFLALFCPTIAAILIFYSYSDPVEAARQMTFLYKTFTGVALLLAGYAGLYVTLAYSRPYRTKPWFG